MTLAQIINIAEQRLVYLARQRETADRQGDMVQISSIDTELSETQNTLTQLRSLSGE